jgi:LPS sulfotransferase NodH
MTIFTPSTPLHNDHMSVLEAHFGPIGRTHTCVRRDTRYVFLCFTNRCGSNFIASGLSSSGYLNTAGEYFNSDAIIENCQANKLSGVADYFNWLPTREGKNDLLVAKIACNHLEILDKAGILDQILDVTQFIMTERSDILAQSISYDLAMQTGSWLYDMARRKADCELVFSRERLIGIMEAIIGQNRDFWQFFALNGVAPATVVYEQFVADPAAQISFLARQLGLADLIYVPERIELRKQEGHINRIWRDRYMRETGRGGNGVTTDVAADHGA